ncbi:MAG: phosphatase PAP2 family protein [Bacteroidia bacterium]|nr:phosphatase PAP2 family protein [Bacteroidia bacterium]
MYWKRLNTLVEQHRLYLILFTLWIFGLTIIQLLYTQKDISLIINQSNTNFLDILCKYGTHIGDGLFAVAIALLIFWQKREYFLIAAIVFISSALFTQLLKHSLFSDFLRPINYVSEIASIHFVEGVTIHKYNSFPSGHSTSIFAVCAVLHFIIPNKKIGTALLLVAVFAGFTRIYLLQHFTIDVFVGSIIGTLFAVLIFPFNKQKA